MGWVDHSDLSSIPRRATDALDRTLKNIKETRAPLVTPESRELKDARGVYAEASIMGEVVDMIPYRDRIPTEAEKEAFDRFVEMLDSTTSCKVDPPPVR